MATAIEGFEMAKRGRAKPALATAALGSFVAGTIGLLLLTFLAQPIADLAVKLQPADYFALVVLAFVAVTSLIGRSLIRGLLSLALGLAIGLIGIDQLTGQARLTFGVDQLFAGVDIVIVAVGLFAIGEALHMASRMRRATRRSTPPSRGATLVQPRRPAALVEAVAARHRRSGSRSARCRPAAPRSRRSCPTRPSAGSPRARRRRSSAQGAIEGVAGPEAANNAAFTGVLVPLLTIGIPTSATAAILLASFQIFDLQPGPQLFENEPDLVWALIASLYVGNVMLLVLNLPLIRLWVKVLEIPRPVLYTAILVFATLGVYSISGSVTEVLIAYAIGVLGLRDAPLRLPDRARDPRRHPRPAGGAAAAPHAARLRRRLRPRSSTGRSPRPSWSSRCSRSSSRCCRG